MSIIIAIVIGLIILGLVVIVFVNPKKEEGRAIEILRNEGLEELQKPHRVPPLHTLITGVSEETVFRMRATIWFEALLAETFAKPRDFPSDVSFLTSQYVRFLTTLGDYLSERWSDAFVETRNTAEAVRPGSDQQGWYLFVLHKSLEWLHKVATEHNHLAELRDASIVKWETVLFESSFEHAVEQHGLGPMGVQDSIKFRLTPGALKREIERLSAPSAQV